MGHRDIRTESSTEDNDTVRLDRWLWAARAFKTRTLAARACAAGQVSVEGRTAKASRSVRPGDVVSFRTPAGARVWRIRALAVRRGPAAQAVTLYEDETPAAPPRPAAPIWDRPDPAAGQRPSKRDRRARRRFKGSR